MHCLLIIFTLIIVSFNPAKSNNDFIDTIQIIPSRQAEYPEEINKSVHVYKGVSPMAKTAKQEQFIQDWFSSNRRSVTSLISEVGFNNFSLGTGRVDVTMQVRRGVKYAIRDVMDGYPEYQRRKKIEEILNANFISNKLNSRFLLGISGVGSIKDNWIPDILYDLSSPLERSLTVSNKLDDFEFAPGIIGTLKTLLNHEFIIDLENVFANFAKVVLIILIFFSLIKYIADGEGSITKPVIKGVFVWSLISLSDKFIDYSFKIVKSLSFEILKLSKNYMELYMYDDIFLEIDKSWEFIANQVGYFPAMILSIINILIQFFLYFYLAGLFLSLTLGKIFAPLWSLALFSSKTKINAMNSFINWLKSLITVALIPFVYASIYIIINNFKVLDYAYINIVMSMVGVSFLPFISSIVLANGGGFLNSAFQGYGLMIDTVNSAVSTLRHAIELASMKEDARIRSSIS